MQIALFCASARGLRFLEELRRLAPDDSLAVFTFREEPWEPPFFESIQQAARNLGATFTEVKSIDSQAFEQAAGSPVDLLFAVGWRYLIPPAVYQRARGAYLFHDSLLPAYRGFAPTVWAIVNGEDHTGATLLRMTDAVDKGDIVAQKRIAIAPADEIADVMARVTGAYIELLQENLEILRTGDAPATPQRHELATYGCKWLPEDGRIAWTASSSDVLNLIRATSRPYPGAFTTLAGRKITVWSAAAAPSDFPRYVSRVPGRVAGPAADGIAVLTGDHAVVIREVQLEGESPCRASELLTRWSMTLR